MKNTVFINLLVAWMLLGGELACDSDPDGSSLDAGDISSGTDGDADADADSDADTDTDSDADTDADSDADADADTDADADADADADGDADADADTDADSDTDTDPGSTTDSDTKSDSNGCQYTCIENCEANGGTVREGACETTSHQCCDLGTDSNPGSDGDTDTDADNDTDTDADTDTDTDTDTDLFPGCSRLVQAYNGQRGESFNKGWKFNLGDGGEAESFDDSSWRSLTLPHDWTIEGGFNTGGIGWYRKTFAMDAADEGKRIFVQFDGAYQESDVWINGHHLGSRPYGYSTFEYELTDHLNFGGDNVIAVRVNNSNQPNSRWYSGSGLYRNVWLTKVYPVHFPIHGVVVTSPDISESSASISVKATIQNQLSGAEQPVTVTTTVLDANGTEVARVDSNQTPVSAGSSEEVTMDLTVDSPKRWSIESPNLYQVQVALRIDGEALDTYVVNWGFRTVEANPSTGFHLNGQQMKLQGVNQHHDLGALGAAVNCRAIERQVEILKELGVNAIRLSHNPHAPELYEVADRLGVLLMDETFDTWTSTKTAGDYGNFFSEWAETDTKAMVRRDRNHPSVFAYSIGNEIYGSLANVAQDLIKWVKEEDDTRLLTWGSNNMDPSRDGNNAAQIAELLDMQGYNYAPYSGNYDTDHAAHPDWAIYGAEVASIVASRGYYITPADKIIRVRDKSEAGITHNYGSDYDNFCMTYSNTAMEAYLYDFERPFSQGMFIWSGFDYIGEPRPFSSPSKNAYYGLVDTAGFLKNAAYFYQSRWTTKPMIHVLPHWNWQQGQMVDIYVYTNCDSAELFLNDVSQGTETMDPSHPRLEWQVAFEPGTLRAECTKDGEAITAEVTTAGDPAAIHLTVDRSDIRASGFDLAFVTADILDGDGNFVATADNDVSFSVSGPGEIVGVDNGSSPDTTPFKETKRAAFSGKVLAIIQSTEEAGEITVTASSGGLDSGTVTINTK